MDRSLLSFPAEKSCFESIRFAHHADKPLFSFFVQFFVRKCRDETCRNQGKIGLIQCACPFPHTNDPFRHSSIKRAASGCMEPTGRPCKRVFCCFRSCQRSGRQPCCMIGRSRSCPSKHTPGAQIMLILPGLRFWPLENPGFYAWGRCHFQSRISGRSWPTSWMYCLCSTSLSFICWIRYAPRLPSCGRCWIASLTR